MTIAFRNFSGLKVQVFEKGYRYGLIVNYENTNITDNGDITHTYNYVCSVSLQSSYWPGLRFSKAL